MRNKYFIRLIMLALVLLAIPASAPTASADFGFGVSVGFAPPLLPVYEQPICPGNGYIWTPGYWAYADDGGYYWVPGTWVIAPQIGYLWTPGYWGWVSGRYFWHGGYWGEHVGFYGGVNYGFGYGGLGYDGGRWDHDRFFYNRSVNNLNISRIHNTYNTVVINNNTNVNRVSYNGGAGGIHALATSSDIAANRDRHIAATSLQVQHERTAGANRAQFATVNKGRPAIVATARPGEFSGRRTVTARATNNVGGNSNNKSAIQNRNAGRDNTFGRSQNKPTRAQGRSNTDPSFGAHTPTNTARPQQFNRQRSTPNNTQNHPRQSAARPSHSAPAQRNNVTRPETRPAFRQNTSHFAPQVPSGQYAAPEQHAAPSYSSRPSVPQHASAPRQQNTPQRSTPQSQPRTDSRTTTGNNGGKHSRR